MTTSATSRYIQVAAAVVACFTATGCSPHIVTPQASTFTGQSGGCGDFFVYRFNSDKTLAITVDVNEDATQLTAQPVTLEITSDPKSVAVRVLQFRAPAENYFCDDVSGDPPPVANWAAVSGTVVVESNPGIPPKDFANATHNVSVILNNVRLKNSKSGEIVVLHELKITNVWVGWLPG